MRLFKNALLPLALVASLYFTSVQSTGSVDPTDDQTNQQMSENTSEQSRFEVHLQRDERRLYPFQTIPTSVNEELVLRTLHAFKFGGSVLNNILENFAQNEKIVYFVFRAHSYGVESMVEHIQSKLLVDIPWDVVSETASLSEEFILKNREYLDLSKVLSQRQYSDEFYAKIDASTHWDSVSRVRGLAPLFIESNILSLNLKHVLEHTKIDNIKVFFEKHEQIINSSEESKNEYYTIVSRCQDLDDGFIRLHSDFLNWRVMSRHQTFTRETIDEHFAKIWWGVYLTTHVIDPKIVYYIDKNIISFGKSHIDELINDKTDKCIVSFVRNVLSQPNLKTKFMNRYIKYINWDTIQCPGDDILSEDLVKVLAEQNSDALNWTKIAMCVRNLSTDFLFVYGDKLGWKNISKYTNLGSEHYRMMYDKIVWKYVSKYQNIPIDIFEEFGSKINPNKLILYNKHISETTIVDISDTTTIGESISSGKYELNSLEKVFQEVRRPLIIEAYIKKIYMKAKGDPSSSNETDTNNASNNTPSDDSSSSKTDVVGGETSSVSSPRSQTYITISKPVLSLSHMSICRCTNERVVFASLELFNLRTKVLDCLLSNKYTSGDIRVHIARTQEYIPKVINLFEKKGIDVPWDVISALNLSEEFIRDHIDKINWSVISQVREYSLEFYDTWSEHIDWESVSRVKNLSSKLVEKYADELSWDLVVENTQLSTGHLYHFEKRIDWKKASKYQVLIHTIIDRKHTLLDWELVCAYQKLSFETVVKFMKQYKLNFETIFLTSTFSPEEVGKFINIFKFGENREYSDQGMRTILNQKGLEPEMYIRHAYNSFMWRLKCEEDILSEEVISELKHVDWKWVAKCKRRLSSEFITTHSEKLTWDNISRYTILSSEQIIEFHKQLDWKKASRYQVFDYESARNFRHLINWIEFFRNKNIETSVMEKLAIIYFGVVHIKKGVREIIDEGADDDLFSNRVVMKKVLELEMYDSREPEPEVIEHVFEDETSSSSDNKLEIDVEDGVDDEIEINIDNNSSGQNIDVGEVLDANSENGSTDGDDEILIPEEIHSGTHQGTHFTKMSVNFEKDKNSKKSENGVVVDHEDNTTDDNDIDYEVIDPNTGVEDEHVDIDNIFSDDAEDGVVEDRGDIVDEDNGDQNIGDVGNDVGGNGNQDENKDENDDKKDEKDDENKDDRGKKVPPKRPPPKRKPRPPGSGGETVSVSIFIPFLFGVFFVM